MMNYGELLAELESAPRTWVVTGVAGFIGSNLLEHLLRAGQRVIGLDNFSTGHRANLDEVRGLTGEAWTRFEFIEGDIRDLDTCRRVCDGADFVLHQAALGSVPRSIDDPIATHENNLSGFLNMLVAARDTGVSRFVYAASSSTYGDSPTLPKVEDEIGRCLSPYAVTKLVNELYAEVFARVYGYKCIGLRYFNIFGPRQDPAGAYAAVIPAWFSALIEGRTPAINGDGETSRDFCHVANCVQANLLAACSPDDAADQVYNVAVGGRTTLNELFGHIRNHVAKRHPEAAAIEPEYRDFRAGDVRHSLADISKAHRLLGYEPSHDVGRGLAEAADWYLDNLASRQTN